MSSITEDLQWPVIDIHFLHDFVAFRNTVILLPKFCKIEIRPIMPVMPLTTEAAASRLHESNTL